MEERSYLSFSGSSTRSVCGKIYMFFFQRKRKSQRRVASKKYRYLLFRRSSISFFLFFPFIYTQRHSPFRLRLLLPGWCLNQPRGGGLRPLLACGRVEVFFFQGKEESQKKVATRACSSLLFRHLCPFFFFQGKAEPKSRWRPVE